MGVPPIRPAVAVPAVAPERRTYSIGDLVTAAYERAAMATKDPQIGALIATQLLAEWLARATFPASMPIADGRGRTVFRPEARVEPARRAAA